MDLVTEDINISSSIQFSSPVSFLTHVAANKLTLW